MASVVANPDPGEQHHPRQNGHSPGLMVAAPREYEPPLALVPELVAEQSSILDQEFTVLLAEESGPADPTDVADPANMVNRTTPGTAPLLGFDTLTDQDLWVCPPWCVHGDLPVHGDDFDTDPSTAPHRSVEHGLHPVHGGAGIDHAGRADVTLRLKQERDLSTGPVVTLSVVIRGIEQYAWLTLPEARALRGLLDQLLTDTDS